MGAVGGWAADAVLVPLRPVDVWVPVGGSVVALGVPLVLPNVSYGSSMISSLEASLLMLSAVLAVTVGAVLPAAGAAASTWLYLMPLVLLKRRGSLPWLLSGAC